VFNGEPEEWSYWEEKFLARASKKGFKDVLTGIVKAPDDSEMLNLTTEEGKEKSKAQKLNILAFEELILSIDMSKDKGKIAFQIVKNCKTTTKKGGDGVLAWKRLKAKYAPKIAPRKMELIREFQRLTLKSSREDPDVWLTNLESIQTKLSEMSYTISDEQLMIHVLNNLPEKYDIQVSKLESQLNDQTSPLSIGDI